MDEKRAVILLSGGLDSATTLAVAISAGYHTRALSVYYGQRHGREIESACRIAEFYKIPHHVLEVPFPWKGSALFEGSCDLPRNRTIAEMNDSIPSTYVPARNTILIALAASLAEAEGAGSIFIGANAVDYSGYPDCRAEYFHAMRAVLEEGTKCGFEGKPVRIQTPLLRLNKSDIIRLGMSLGTPYGLTWSCYDGGERPCEECDSCLLRAKGFKEAGAEDPLLISVHSNKSNGAAT